jgi:carboxypeptidase Taq
MQDKVAQLKAGMAPIVDLTRALMLMSWDQETYMPPGGAATRGEMASTIGGLIHRFTIDPAVGELLKELEPLLDQLDFDSDEAGMIRLALREYRHRAAVPIELTMEIYGTMALAMQAWKEARAKNDFSLFEPLLAKTVELQVRQAKYLQPDGNPYDALLDLYEPGMTYEQIDAVFSALKPGLIELVRAVASRADKVDDSPLRRRIDPERQIAFARTVAAQIGFDFSRGRLDLSAHPFTSGTGRGDARITTRVDPDFLPACLMSVIHESGHGMHLQNINPAFNRTGLDMFSTMAIAESQSRFYENIIGRSRPFWRYFYPQLQAAFAPAFDDVDMETFYRAVNKSQPSLIRVEADEVTYGLHIILRFELENDLINGRVSVSDLPKEWNARMEAYLGVVPPTDTEGVLQDIHWSQGNIGYFPDYLLGSIFSVQLWEAMQKDYPAVAEDIEAGQFEGVLSWLRDKIMRHGRKYTLPELAERATGRPLSVEPFMAYLRAKMGDIYGLA